MIDLSGGVTGGDDDLYDDDRGSDDSYEDHSDDSYEDHSDDSVETHSEDPSDD